MDGNSIDTKKQARLTEWQGWIDSFLSLNQDNPAPEYSPIANAAALLNDYYWRLTLNFLKPLLTNEEGEPAHNLHFYKIISASELTVMAVNPFKFESSVENEIRKQLNAEFAWFVGISILLNWKIAGKEIIDYAPLEKIFLKRELIDISSDGESHYYALNFRDEHIEWLKDINTASPLPLLSNSQTWRLFYIAADAINEIKQP